MDTLAQVRVAYDNTVCKDADCVEDGYIVFCIFVLVNGHLSQVPVAYGSFVRMWCDKCLISVLRMEYIVFRLFEKCFIEIDTSEWTQVRVAYDKTVCKETDCVEDGYIVFCLFEDFIVNGHYHT